MSELETNQENERQADRQRNFFLQLQRMLASLTSGIAGMFGGATSQGANSDISANITQTSYNTAQASNTSEPNVEQQYVKQARAQVDAELGENISMDAPEAKTVRIERFEPKTYLQDDPSAVMAYNNNQASRAAYDQAVAENAARDQAYDRAIQGAYSQEFASNVDKDIAARKRANDAREIMQAREDSSTTPLPKIEGVDIETLKKASLTGAAPSGNTDYTKNDIFQNRETGLVIDIPKDENGKYIGQVLIEEIGGAYRISVVDSNVDVTGMDKPTQHRFDSAFVEGVSKEHLERFTTINMDGKYGEVDITFTGGKDQGDHIVLNVDQKGGEVVTRGIKSRNQNYEVDVVVNGELQGDSRYDIAEKRDQVKSLQIAAERDARALERAQAMRAEAAAKDAIRRNERIERAANYEEDRTRFAQEDREVTQDIKTKRRYDAYENSRDNDNNGSSRSGRSSSGRRAQGHAPMNDTQRYGPIGERGDQRLAVAEQKGTNFSHGGVPNLTGGGAGLGQNS